MWRLRTADGPGRQSGKGGVARTQPYSVCGDNNISDADAAPRSWRSRYGANIPFIAGTFSPSLPLGQPYSYSFQDFMRFNFDPSGVPGTTYGTPGGPPRCTGTSGSPTPCYDQLNSPALMVTLSTPLTNLGLADSYYVTAPGSAPALSVAPHDGWYASTAGGASYVAGAPVCANASLPNGMLFVGAGAAPAGWHQSCNNYAHFSVYGLQLMGQRYYNAWAAIVGNATT